MKNFLMAVFLGIMSGQAMANMPEYLGLEDCLQMASVMQPEEAAKIYAYLESIGAIPLPQEEPCDR